MQPGLHGSDDLCVRRKMATFQVFFQSGRAKDLSVSLYSFFNLGARWGWVVKATPRPLYPWERPGTHCIGGRMGPRTGPDGCGKSRSDWDSIPGPSSTRVAILTALSRPTTSCCTGILRSLSVWKSSFLLISQYKKSVELNDDMNYGCDMVIQNGTS
jgi:hypothetical protein